MQVEIKSCARIRQLALELQQRENLIARKDRELQRQVERVEASAASERELQTRLTKTACTAEREPTRSDEMAMEPGAQPSLTQWALAQAAESAAAVERERDAHESAPQATRALTQEAMSQLLLDCCRELRLQDASLLPAALRKMCRAIAALPLTEAHEDVHDRPSRVRDRWQPAARRGRGPRRAQADGRAARAQDAPQIRSISRRS